jgi:hypothetical protein
VEWGILALIFSKAVVSVVGRGAERFTGFVRGVISMSQRGCIHR